MRDITDPASPYAGQYTAWDNWIYAGAFEQSKSGRRGMSQQGTRWYSAEVTDAGYVKPQLATLSEGLDRLRGLIPPSDDHCVHMVSMAGNMDPALEAELNAATGRIWAERYAQIPAWLAGQPALRNMVLPNGEVVTLGEAGASAASGGKRPSGPQAYYRYSSTGELLGQSLPGEMWQALYFKDWTSTVLLEQLKAQRLPRVVRGCTVFVDRQSEAVGAVFTYDGRALAADTDLSQLEPVLLTELTAKQVAEIYQAQQKLLAQGGAPQ